MESFDALTLARLQFAFTVSFHIVFPAFSIGLASYLAVLEGLWLATGRGVYLAVFNYWKKIFADYSKFRAEQNLHFFGAGSPERTQPAATARTAEVVG